MTKDFMKEFRGKSRLTNREFKLMWRRIQSRKIKSSQTRSTGYGLSRSHINKGVKWLRKNWKGLTKKQLILVGATPESARKSVGSGYKLKPSWGNMDNVYIRLIGFAENFYPVYQVTRAGTRGSFRYYVKFGSIIISKRRRVLY
jgi:hypothetical protein